MIDHIWLKAIVSEIFLKRRNFTPIPLSNSVISKVNAIGKKKNQGFKFRFTNRRNEPFGWTDEVQEDDKEFQGLLEQDEAPFRDISAKLPGIELERNQTDDQTDGPTTDAINNEPEPNFEELATGALENADIRPGNHIQNQPTEAPVNAPVEPREVVCDIEINLLNDTAPVAVNKDQLVANGGAI